MSSPTVFLGAALVWVAPFLTPAEMPAPFLGDLDSARRAASERNTPLVIAVIQEGEEANDRFASKVYADPKFAAATADTVLILVNDGLHKRIPIREKNKQGETVERQVCERFHVSQCGDHKRLWSRVFQAYNRDGTMKTPQLLVLLPGGEILERIVDNDAAGVAIDAIGEAKKLAGPSLSTASLLDVKQLTDTGRTMAKARLWIEALKAWQGVLALTQTGQWADEARKGLDAAVDGLRGDIRTALERMEAGQVESGYDSLLKLRDALRKTPLEKEAVDAVKTAEKRPEWKERIESVKRAREADKLWEQVLAKLGQEKEKAAESIAKKILRKFPGTPAAERAAERFPHLVKKESGSWRL